MNRITMLVTQEIVRASAEHNPAAELEEIAHHLERQLKRVRGRIEAAKGGAFEPWKPLNR